MAVRVPVSLAAARSVVEMIVKLAARLAVELGVTAGYCPHMSTSNYSQNHLLVFDRNPQPEWKVPSMVEGTFQPKSRSQPRWKVPSGQNPAASQPANKSVEGTFPWLFPRDKLITNN